MQDSSTTITGINDLKEHRNDVDDDRRSIESVDRRTVSLLRLLLAACALLITTIDTSTPERFTLLAYVVLTGYSLYSLSLYFLVLQEKFLIPVRYTHWIDVCWYAILVGISHATSSIFFFFFFFAILVAAFRWGYKEGIYVTGVVAVLFIVIAYAAPAFGESFELNRFLIRPLYLVVFGYMISMWGGRELVFRRRLTLLRDINRLSNPRFGINRTLHAGADRLRAFYGADSCLLISAAQPHSKLKIWRAEKNSDAGIQMANEDEFGARVAELAGDHTIRYTSNKGTLFQGPECCYVDPVTGAVVNRDPVDCDALVQLLNTESFIVIPVYQHDELIGRLCLRSDQRPFEISDVSFVRQLIEQVLPGIENVQLLDRLASQAAERQRETTSRDIHDSTIQPYIGLKLGLEALQLKVERGQPVESDIQKLLMLADTTISELRGFAKNLRDTGSNEAQSVLVTAVRQQALKFQQFYGINVEVKAAEDFRLNDRLAAEAFQIITEGLSNIKRHTSAKNALISILVRSDTLVLTIENGNQNTVPGEGFIPKSISGRARSLGGRASTEISDAWTRVTVTIPM
jgi:signal transduction histidine kinase